MKLIEEFDCFDVYRKESRDGKQRVSSFKLCEYGRMLDLTEPVFSEEEASQIMKSILNGVAQIHEKNLLHRDIKPENIVMGGHSRPDYNTEILDTDTIKGLKIIDFGFSAQTKQTRFDDLDQNIGTTLFMAPE